MRERRSSGVSEPDHFVMPTSEPLIRGARFSAGSWKGSAPGRDLVRSHRPRRWHERRRRLRTSLITAALLAAFGATALITPASAAPLSPAPAATVSGDHAVTNVRWHPIRRMRRMMHRHRHHRV